MNGKKKAEERLSKQMLARLWDFFSKFLKTAREELESTEDDTAKDNKG